MGNCVAAKGKDAKQNTSKPPQVQEPSTIEKKEEPNDSTPAPQPDQVTVEQVANTVAAVDGALRENGVDVVQIATKVSSKVYNDLWAMCTAENALKLMEMASSANDKLLENGIDV